jgi:hypothetical protein
MRPTNILRISLLVAGLLMAIAPYFASANGEMSSQSNAPQQQHAVGKGGMTGGGVPSDAETCLKLTGGCLTKPGAGAQSQSGTCTSGTACMNPGQQCSVGGYTCQTWNFGGGACGCVCK